MSEPDSTNPAGSEWRSGASPALSRTALPRRIRVAEVISSRYKPGTRPVLWEQRAAGVEKIKTVDGDQVQLYSTGGQSSPAPGWELLLLKERINPTAAESPGGAVLWTLYGLPNAAHTSAPPSRREEHGESDH